MSNQQNNAKAPVTEDAKFIDTRIIGTVILIIAALILGISMFLRILDVKKSEGFEKIDGEVAYIQTTRKFVQRKTRTKTTVTVHYYLEDIDLTYHVSGSSFFLDYAKKGDIVTVCYEKDNPSNSFIAEKDWITGGYYHAGGGYNGALIVAACVGLLGYGFMADGISEKKKAAKKTRQAEQAPQMPQTTQPAPVPAPQIPPRRIRHGDIVTVTVDRPLGSYHPEHKDMYYPVNYGYIEGVIAADGEEQDAYILGVDEPVKEFTGEVIGIVHRDDDVETKLVVAPQGSTYTAEQVMEQINFTEKFYKSHVVMKLEDIDVDPEALVALGFKIRKGHCCYFLSMDETPSKETLLKLFDLLTIEQELTFWSFYRYSGSDPGEYVTVSVENGKAVAIRGNHGWSSGYESISIDDLIELIQRNWDKDWDSIKNYVNSIELRQVPLPESRRIWMEHPTGVFVPDYSLRAW